MNMIESKLDVVERLKEFCHQLNNLCVKEIHLLASLKILQRLVFIVKSCVVL
jgi:hypothetical protein